MSHPILIILIKKDCVFCELLLKNWDKIIQSILTVYPQMRFPIQTVETKQYKYPPIHVENNTINYNLFPKNLSNYILWYPFIMLIPGYSWDQCNLNLGMNNTSSFENVQIMNANITNGIIKPFNQYNMRITTKYTEYFTIWIKEALKNITYKNEKFFLKPIEYTNDILNIISR